MNNIDLILEDVPLVAILRGLTVERAVDVVSVLIESGIRLIEVPLNSPQPFQSIEKICTHHEGKAIFGAGTVLSAEQVDRLKDVGGTLVVSPHTDCSLIEHSLSKGLVPVPGFYTASEAMTALRAGANYLKFFPADLQIYRSLRAILPKQAKVVAVGGVRAETLSQWSHVVGFGVGSALFHPNDSLDDIHQKASTFVSAARSWS